jgi:hypothetical protein
LHGWLLSLQGYSKGMNQLCQSKTPATVQAVLADARLFRIDGARSHRSLVRSARRVAVTFRS